MNIEKKKICMIVQDPIVKGGISAVVNGYTNSTLKENFDIIYVESYKDGNKLTKLSKALIGYIKFIKILIVYRPELIHIHSSFGASFYRKIPFICIAHYKKIPIINHIHGADFEKFYMKASNIKIRIIKNIYNKCSILIALSEEWKEMLQNIVPKEKIKVVQNYSVINKKAISYRKEKKLNKQVIFLGEVGRRKGCYDIPDVVRKVSSKIPDIKFIICGSGDIDKIKMKAKKLGVDKNISFMGWIKGKEKEALLMESDVFFLPSYNEGMPMAILDAMGYALPIVSTNVGGISKIVKNEVNGYIHKPGDIEKFAESIIDLLCDENKCKKYGIESYNIVKIDYSLESHINKIKEIYYQIIK